MLEEVFYSDEDFALDDAGDLQVKQLNDYGPLLVHVQIRPRREVLGKCVATFNAHLERNPDAIASIVGIAKDVEHVALTIGIDLGKPGDVVRGASCATSGYLLVKDIFEKMFDYTPHYVVAPTEAEAAAADLLPHLVATPTRVNSFTRHELKSVS